MDSINLDRSFKPGDLVMHFKGKQYQILQLATHTETNECLVIYQALYGDYGIYARPYSMFLEKTDRNKYPDTTWEYRFTKIGSIYSCDKNK